MRMNPGMVGRFSSVPTTWNASDKTANISLSGGDLIATAGTTESYHGIRATRFRNTGKHHFEITATTVSHPNNGLGIASTSMPYGTSYLGKDNFGIGYWADGVVYRNSTGVASLATFTSGDIIAVEVDFDGSLIYFQKSGGSRSSGIDISALGSGPFAPALSMVTSGNNATLNAGATAFAVSPTSGFTAWGA